MTRQEAQNLAEKIAGEGFTAPDYKTSIDTSGFLSIEDDDSTSLTVTINWARVDEFALEVAIRTIMEYSNGEPT